ncbi:MAG: epoxyqueuosine reductase QueH [Bacteroidales bacterium]|nr:epoxyqueuosine reductase QueH [Bacteroidales bacterium]
MSSFADMEKVLLHTCCAPCSSAIIEWMLANGWQPTIFYCNPNIYPEEEYRIRKDECTRYAQALGLEIVDDDYDHGSWLCSVKGMEDEPERGPRCLQCFRYRLLCTARYALDHGYTIMTTTLASSRWKSLEQIDAAGRWAVEKALSEFDGDAAPKLEWWEKNWRKGGLQQRRQEIIKEYGFYNQLYCGCEFSMRRLQNDTTDNR